MNHIYKVIFNKATGTFVAVTEYARAAGKGSTGTVNSTSASDTVGTPAPRRYLALKVAVLAILPMMSQMAYAIAYNAGSGSNNTYGNAAASTNGNFNLPGNHYGTPNNPDSELPTEVFGVAVGNAAQSTNASSVALGSHSKANHYSTAIGAAARATVRNDTAIGAAALASGGHSIAIGRQAGATAGYAMAFGTAASVTGANGIGMGKSVLVSGVRGIAIGAPEGATTGNGDYEPNNNTQATGEDSIAFGTKARAKADDATAIGHQATASSASSLALGHEAETNADDAIAIGHGAKTNEVASAGIAIGKNTEVKGYATAVTNLALGSDAQDVATIAIGRNIISQKGTVAVGSNIRSNEGEASVILGRDINVHTNQGAHILIGTNVKADTNANGSIAFGNSSVVDFENSLAVGQSTQATQKHASAFGAFSQAKGEKTIAVGAGAVVQGAGSGAFGSAFDTTSGGVKENHIMVSGTGSFSIGNNNKIENNDTVALGSNITTTAKNSVFLGNEAAYVAKTDTNSTTGGIGAVTSSTASKDSTSLTFNNYAGSSATDVVSVGNADNKRRIQNVAAGLVSATSTDAINGSQLHSTNTTLANVADSIKAVLGAGASVATDGTITFAGATSGTNTGIGGTGKTTIHEAIEAAAKSGSGSSTKVAGTGGEIQVAEQTDTVTKEKTYTVSLDDAVKTKINNADNAIKNTGITFQGDSGQSVTKKLGDTLAIKGGKTADNELTNNNIGVINDNGELKVKLAKDLTELGSATFGSGTFKSVLNKGGLTVQSGTIKTEILPSGIETAGTLKASGPITQGIDGSGKQILIDDERIAGLSQTPTRDDHAANKKYVDDQNNNQNTALKTFIGGGANIGNNTGAITVPNGTGESNGLGGTGKQTIHEAINEVRKNAGGWKLKVNDNNAVDVAKDNVVTFKNGDNIEISNTDKEVTIKVKDAPTFTGKVTANQGLDVTGATTLKGDTTIGGNGKTFKVESGTTVNMGKNVITNVGDAVNGTDAVNKKQMDETVATAKTALTNQGLKFEGDAGGAVTKKLGDTLAIKGGKTVDSELTDNNIGVTKDGDALKIKLAKKLTGLTDVSTGNLTATGKVDAGTLAVTSGATVGGTLGVTGAITQGTTDNGGNQITINNGVISGLIAPTADNHAANKKYVDDQDKKQNEGLKTLLGGTATIADNAVTATNIGGTNQSTIHGAIDSVRQTAEKGFKLQANNANESIIKPGDTVNIAQGENIVVSKSGNTITIATSKTPTFDSLTTRNGATIGGALQANGTLNVTGDTTLAKTTVNGDLTATNGTTALGTTTIGGASKTLTVSNGTTVNMGKNRITNVADGTAEEDAVNKKQMDKAVADAKDALTNQGLKFEGDAGGEVSRKLGETLTIKGGKTVADELTEDNIGVTKDGDGGLKIKLAKNLTGLTSVTTQNLTATGTTSLSNTTVNGTLGVTGKTTLKETEVSNLTTTGTATIGGKLTANGGLTVGKSQTVDMGNNVITNVGTGTQDTDAVNKKQMADTIKTAVGNSGWNLKTNANPEVKVANNETVTFKNGNNIEITNTGRDVTVKVADAPTFAGKVTAKGGLDVTGDTMLQNATVGGTLGVTNAITQGQGTNQITINDGKITGLADLDGQSDGKQAANKNYVDNQNTAQNNGLKALLGGNAKVENGTVTSTNIGGTNQTTIDGAISEVRTSMVNTFKGDNDKVEVKPANGLINIVGGTPDPTGTGLADGNIGVVGETGGILRVKLAKNLVGLTNVNTENLTATEAINTKDLTATGNTSLKNTTIDGTLGVTGKTTLKETEIGGKLTANGGLTVGGNQTVDMGGNAITNVGEAKNNTDAVNKKQMDEAVEKATKTLTDNGLKFEGDAGGEVSRKLGETLTIKGGKATDNDLTDNNIGVTKDGDGGLKIKLAKDLTGLTSVTTQNLTATGTTSLKNTTVDGTLTVNGATTLKGDTTVEKFTANGDTTIGGRGKTFKVVEGTTVDMGNNVITNVGTGTQDTDAVNKKQMDDAVKTAVGKSGFTVKAPKTKDGNDDTSGEKIANDDTLVFDEGSNIKITRDGKTITVKVSDSPNFAGTLTAGNITTAGTVNAGQLFVTGSSMLAGNTTVGGNFTAQRDVLVHGNTTLEKDLTVKGNTNLKGNTTVEKDLTVSGNTTVEKFTANGDTHLKKDLTVDGNTNLKKDLTVDGSTNLKGDTTVEKALTVKGDTTVEKFTANGDTHLKNNLTVDGSTNLKGDTTVEKFTANGDATLKGNTTVGGNGKTFKVESGTTVDMGGNVITGIKAGNTDDSAVNKKQMDDAVEQATKKLTDTGLIFAGDAGGDVSKKLGEKLTIKGGADAGQLTDNNIGVINERGELKVKLAQDVNLGSDGSITAGTGDKAVKLDGTQGNITVGGNNATTITKDKITVGGANDTANPVSIDGVNRVITGLKDNLTQPATGANTATKPTLDDIAKKAPNATATNPTISNAATVGDLGTVAQATQASIAATKTDLEKQITAAKEGGLQIKYTNKDGKELVKDTDGNWYPKNDDGSSNKTKGAVAPSDVVAKATNPFDNTKSLGLSNISSGLDSAGVQGADDKAKLDNLLTVTDNAKLNNATNVGDLKTVAQGLVEKGTAYQGDDSTVTVNRKLGEALIIKGGITGENNATTNAAIEAKLTNKNIGVVSDANGTLEVKLAKNVDLGADGSVTLGKDDKQVKLNGADGTLTTGDGVNGKQAIQSATGLTVKDTANGQSQQATYGANGIQFQTPATTVGGTATPIENSVMITKDGMGFAPATVGGAKDTNGFSTAAPIITANGINAGGQAISNVGSAFNGANFANQLAIINGTATPATPAPTAADKATAQKAIIDAVKGATNTNAINAADLGAVTTAIDSKIDQTKDELKNQGTSYKGDDGVTVQRKLGDTLTIKGGAKADSLTNNNIGVVGNTDGTLEVKLNKDINLGDNGSLTVGAGDKTIKLDGNTGNANIGGSLTVSGDTNLKGNTTVGGNGKTFKVENGTTVDMGGNKITNVGKATQNGDAVNYEQFKELANSVGTGISSGGGTKPVVTDSRGEQATVKGDDGKETKVDITPNEALRTYDAKGAGTVETNSVFTAIKNINEQGTKYMHVNGGEKSLGGVRGENDEQSRANGAKSTAIGYKTTSDGDHAVAVGNVAEAVGEQSVAIGDNARAIGKQSIAIGTGNVVTGNNSGAFGDPNTVSGNDSYAFGNDNTVSSNNTFVLGNNVTQTADNSVALGNNTAITANAGKTLNTDGSEGVSATTAGATGTVETATVGNMTYGGFEGATANGAVSVGASGNERRIQNVAAGEISATSTDAINGSQLYAVADGLGNRMNHIDARIGDVEDDANAGVSSAMAMASLPQAYIPGKSMLTGGIATYNGEGAVAVGLSKLSDNGRWVLKISGSADTRGNAGAAVGAGFHF